MKKNIFILAILALSLIFVVSAPAQTVSLTTTTTSAAVAATDKSICLTSATGVNVPGVGTTGSLLFLKDDRGGEPVTVRSVTSASASCFNVVRSSRPVAHASGVKVYIGAKNNFYNYQPIGACTLASTDVAPWIDIQANTVYTCTNSVWANASEPIVSSCGTAAAGSAAACSASTTTGQTQVIVGTVALTTGSPSVAHVTAMPAFASTVSYACTATSQTTQTTVVKAIPVSATAFDITGPNTNTDVISYICVGTR